MMPQNIRKEHIISAIDEIRNKGVPKGRDSRKYKLIFDGQLFPPKYVIALANKYANGEDLDPSVFNGGAETNSFLESRGFTVVNVSSPEIPDRPTIIPEQPNMARKPKHDERCPECKKIVESMLRKLYGDVESNHKFIVGAHIEDYRGRPFYSYLEKIFTDLQNYRGYKSFVKTRTLPRCDFFVPNPGFLVEFDESQHFTIPRKQALSHYPDSLKLGFPKEKWIDLCSKIQATDNDPCYRDEQRGWYDTLRDFLPEIEGLAPTVRLYSKDMRWCQLDPDNPSDVKRFMTFIQSNEDKLTISFNPTEGATIARVILAGPWQGDISDVRMLLNNICQIWPSGHKVKYLLTCGGFVNFPWVLFRCAPVWDYPKTNMTEEHISIVERFCDSLLDRRLRNKLKMYTRYITIGIDSFEVINNTNRPHRELVGLLDLEHDKWHWTGKSYPTGAQEKGLIRVADLMTHFVNLQGEKVMILGCHDLNMFSNRAIANTKREWRREISRDMINLVTDNKPTRVLHHPHSTDSKKTWTGGLSGLQEKIPTLREFAGSGKWYNSGGKQRSPLNEVLNATKIGKTTDIIVETDCILESEKLGLTLHTARHAASELVVERYSDGVLLGVQVDFQEKDPPERFNDNGEIIIDLTRRDFQITITVDKIKYSDNGEWGSSTLRDLYDRLVDNGYRLRSCFSCYLYRPTRMISDWSFGTEGYCVLNGKLNMDELTHILHICPSWLEDRDRDSGNKF